MDKAFRDDPNVPVRPSPGTSKAYRWAIPVGIFTLLLISTIVGSLCPSEEEKLKDMPIKEAAISASNEEFSTDRSNAMYDEKTKTLIIQPYVSGMSFKHIFLSTKFVMKKLHNLDANSITFQFQGATKDVYGNIKTEIVLRYTFPRALIDKIDWENFDYENIPIVCENYWSK